MKVALAWTQPLSYASACDLCAYVLVQNGFQCPAVEGVSGWDALVLAFWAAVNKPQCY